MRILHIVTIMNTGGIETMLMNLYRNIDRNKIQFDFITHRNEVGFYDAEIKELGGHIYKIPHFKPDEYFEYKKRLMQIIIENPSYKIIHSHINQYSYIPLKIAKKAGVPIRIAHGHQVLDGLRTIPLKRIPVLLYCKSRIKSSATDYFSCSKEAGEWLFGSNNEVKILRNSIDAEKYIFSEEKRQAKRNELNLKEEFIIGHIGNFSGAKNYSFILDVFKSVLKHDSNTVLMLVGNKKNNPEVEKKVNEMGLNDKVIFTGVRSDIPELIQAMDLFLFPSLHEGLPVSLIEAQAGGLKCIISDTITEEVKITDLIEFISLDKTPDYWAERILEHQVRYDRRDTFTEIKRSGYDVKEATKELETFYLEQLSRVK